MVILSRLLVFIVITFLPLSSFASTASTECLHLLQGIPLTAEEIRKIKEQAFSYMALPNGRGFTILPTQTWITTEMRLALHEEFRGMISPGQRAGMFSQDGDYIIERRFTPEGVSLKGKASLPTKSQFKLIYHIGERMEALVRGILPDSESRNLRFVQVELQSYKSGLDRSAAQFHRDGIYLRAAMQIFGNLNTRARDRSGHIYVTDPDSTLLFSGSARDGEGTEHAGPGKHFDRYEYVPRTAIFIDFEQIDPEMLHYENTVMMESIRYID